jgi:hypothetical protein
MRYYVARKGKYALLCMAMCDAECRILWYDISQSPQTHDSLAWSVTQLGVRRRGEGVERHIYSHRRSRRRYLEGTVTMWCPTNRARW